MLLEFSVSNYLSFREKQTLTMTAAPRLRKLKNTFSAPVKGEKLPNLLKVAVIYGPNASGKSNLLRAMALADGLSRHIDRPDWLLPVSHFRFDKELANQPSCFEWHFLSERQRYEFVLEATPERITRERLTAYPNGVETLLYERQHSSGSEQYTFGALEGGDAVREAWQKLTPPRALFLSQAVANSSEDLRQLRAPHSWIASSTFNLGTKHGEAVAEHSLRLTEDDESHGADIAKFLHDLDVPVTRVRIESGDAGKGESSVEGAESFANLRVAKKVKSARKSAIFTHKTALGEADFHFSEESDGTKNLVGFWLPWIVRSAPDDTQSRCILTADELDSSLHPAIVASLVQKHLDAKQPWQLIFSTHDTHLLDAKLLRRDQIWITERDKNGATQLRCIHDFEGREGEDLEKRYFEGRYRGLPIVR